MHRPRTRCYMTIENELRFTSQHMLSIPEPPLRRPSSNAPAGIAQQSMSPQGSTSLLERHMATARLSHQRTLTQAGKAALQPKSIQEGSMTLVWQCTALHQLHPPRTRTPEDTVLLQNPRFQQGNRIQQPHRTGLEWHFLQSSMCQQRTWYHLGLQSHWNMRILALQCNRACLHPVQCRSNQLDRPLQSQRMSQEGSRALKTLCTEFDLLIHQDTSFQQCIRFQKWSKNLSTKKTFV